MKGGKVIKKLAVVVILLVVAFLMSSCSLDFTWEFINDSSKRVTVQCSELDPSLFYLNAGERRTIKTPEQTIQIYYDPVSTVNANLSAKGREGKVVFTDR